MTRPADTHGDWVLWRAEGYGRVQVYVSPGLAAELDAENRRRQDDLIAADKAEREERIRVAEEEIAARKAMSAEATKAIVTTIGPHRAHEYEVHRHTIFPKLELVAERVQRIRDGLYGDKDHTTRELKSLGAALERGSDRSVVRTPEWRQSLDYLAAELPAFRDAIDIVANALALSAVTFAPPAIPPLLLVGPPGVGKSYFCRRLAETMESGSAWLGMDQPTAGCELRGSDSHWSTARHGVLFELLGLGETANPFVFLDEIDKAPRRKASQETDPLGQLYSALEPETAQHLSDVSLDVDIDASQVMYIATANGLRTLDAALLSRFEVIQVGLPSQEERRESAARIVESALARLGVRGVVRVRPGCIVVLADFSARVIKRATEKAVAAAISSGRTLLQVEDFEIAMGQANKHKTTRMH